MEWGSFGIVRSSWITEIEDERVDDAVGRRGCPFRGTFQEISEVRLGRIPLGGKRLSFVKS